MAELPFGGPWPESPEDLERLQTHLGAAETARWRPTRPPEVFGACFVTFAKHRSGVGARGEPAWAAAVTATNRRLRDYVTVQGKTGAAYHAGLLAIREGPLLELAMRALPEAPSVLIVDATGRDHPRRAGLALHLGAVLDLPTVGVTQRTLIARGEWPEDSRHSRSPLWLEDELVGYWLRSRAGTRPIAVHAAWRTDPETALEVVMAAIGRARTPEPLRRARRVARLARAGRLEELQA